MEHNTAEKDFVKPIFYVLKEEDMYDMNYDTLLTFHRDMCSVVVLSL